MMRADHLKLRSNLPPHCTRQLRMQKGVHPPATAPQRHNKTELAPVHHTASLKLHSHGGYDVMLHHDQLLALQYLQPTGNLTHPHCTPEGCH